MTETLPLAVDRAPLYHQVDALAGEIGRLRRRVDGESYDGLLVERIAGHVETIDILIRPTAAEIFETNIRFGADEEEAVEEALADVDGRSRQLLRLLGREERR